MKNIYLNKKDYCIVDDKDYKELIQYKWRLNTTGYATRTSRSISMHRQIMKAQKGQYVDHINGEKLDNRRCNLRLVTNQQNCWNTKKRTRPFGVCKSKSGNWRAYCVNDHKQYHLGTWKDKKDAMAAYDFFVLKTRGKFAVTNKILGFY